jgi:glycosyltransferase involved in cell wall biosynthesis
VYRRGRTTALEEWRRGERSSDFFYGLMALEKTFNVGFIEETGFNPIHKPWYLIERVIAQKMGAGFALHVALWNLGALRRANVIVSTGDVCGLPIAFLKSLGLLKSRIIYITHGMSDHARRHGFETFLSRFYRKLLRTQVDQLVALSEGGQAGLADWLGLRQEQVINLPYGTDIDFWTPAERTNQERAVVSIGSDSGRDFDILIAAANDVPVHIVTDRNLNISGKENIRRTTKHSFRELRDIYRQAAFVVVSLYDRDQPSGQSTGLQAMSCGKAIVLTKTRGWWGENFLKHKENCWIVPPGDQNALHEAITFLWNNPSVADEIGRNARRTVEMHFSEKRMIDGLRNLIETSLEGKNANRNH